ncbi:hypothetical protein DNTS_009338, partial [Danionella cerebrum]
FTSTGDGVESDRDRGMTWPVLGGYLNAGQSWEGDIEKKPLPAKEILICLPLCGLMMWKLLLLFTLLLTVLEPLLSHPVVSSPEMNYGRPVVAEEQQLLSPEDLSFSEQFLSQDAAGFGFPSLIPGEISTDDLRTAGFVPSQAVKEVLLEKPLLSRFLGGRKQFRKRGSNTECFWKYCV